MNNVGKYFARLILNVLFFYRGHTMQFTLQGHSYLLATGVNSS